MRRSSSLSPEACEHQLNIWSCLVLAAGALWSALELFHHWRTICCRCAIPPLFCRYHHCPLFWWESRICTSEVEDFLWGRKRIFDFRHRTLKCFLAEIVWDTEDVCKYIIVSSRINNDNVRQCAIVNWGILVLKGWEQGLISSLGILVPTSD